MNNQRQEVDMGFTRELFPKCAHMCLIFDSEAQRRTIVSQFLAAGLKQGEIVRYFVDETTPEEVRAWLLEAGAELVEAKDNGPLGIFQAEGAYCPSGRFEPQAMIARMIASYAAAQKAGYSGTRSCGEMTWALKGIPGSDRLLEYEALISTITETFPHMGMCQYDARRFDGATLLNVLRVHPYMVAQGQIVRNPYYVRPQEFLAECGSKPA